ncbi:hypothetical protein [Haloarcula sp. JP-Z28]|uniref:hypothetical protein n=1 Tax=Haloarcula sp. JP-Z28 TaxID=2716715 RepID=UPI0019623E26|nr:hypothetical protein [Haloarcula sp. JP-Z28]
MTGTDAGSRPLAAWGRRPGEADGYLVDSSVGLAGGLRARETSVCRRGTDGRAETGGWLVCRLTAGQPPLGGTLALAGAGALTDGRRRGYEWRVSRV